MKSKETTMCYDIKASLEAQLKRALRDGDANAVDEIMERLVPLTDLPLFHASGFSHPELLIYTDDSPSFPEVATWGLVPQWVEDNAQQKKIWNNTLNARGETIFSKPSFEASARNHRCIIYVDGFYEHHHFNNKTYPFLIERKDGEPIAFAGLYSDYRNEAGGIMKTFTIVTTTGNALLAKIHNNPKLAGPRMPLILDLEAEELWLQKIDHDRVKDAISQLIHEFPAEKLKAHTVGRLRGKEYLGNVEQISEEVVYPELEFN